MTDPDILDSRARQEDEWLVVRCQLGELDAFDELVARWQAPLWTYIRRMVGREDEARDVLQDVWVRVVRGIARLRDGARLRAWLFGIARRALMDRLRRQYAAPPIVELGGADVHDPSIESDAIDRETDLAAVELALAALPLAERETLTLFYLRELSLADVAEALAIPAGTVKSRLFRGRRLLRARLSETRLTP